MSEREAAGHFGISRASVKKMMMFSVPPGYQRTAQIKRPKAAGTGLTLTAATHVIHLSRWWNPAVEEQCNDRVHQIGQTMPVTVHVPMAIHPGYQHKSFDCLLHGLMARKRRLASSALWPMGGTEEDAGCLQQMLADGYESQIADPVQSSMISMLKREGVQYPQFSSDGSIAYD
jgi:hypothetical protein